MSGRGNRSMQLEAGDESRCRNVVPFYVDQIDGGHEQVATIKTIPSSPFERVAVRCVWRLDESSAQLVDKDLGLRQATPLGRPLLDHLQRASR